MHCGLVTGIQEYDNEKKGQTNKEDNERLVFKKLLHMGAKLLSSNFVIYREAKGIVYDKHKGSLEVFLCMCGSQHGCPLLRC